MPERSLADKRAWARRFYSRRKDLAQSGRDWYVKRVDAMPEEELDWTFHLAWCFARWEKMYLGKDVDDLMHRYAFRELTEAWGDE